MMANLMPSRRQHQRYALPPFFLRRRSCPFSAALTSSIRLGRKALKTPTSNNAAPHSLAQTLSTSCVTVWLTSPLLYYRNLQRVVVD
ncbi:hypothetical protein BDN72DRAFT_843764 [Pluteus cervinus]|uniref:Uncharacterized protein n=1 Tax=Pluteus cervinus TaxID=181527 RepID=A0ACD3AML2_9AGAR|nr:hypothetical protein BDN72DRAFT_843764 [Pluteus cervinus]